MTRWLFVSQTSKLKYLMIHDNFGVSVSIQTIVQYIIFLWQTCTQGSLVQPKTKPHTALCRFLPLLSSVSLEASKYLHHFTTPSRKSCGCMISIPSLTEEGIGLRWWQLVEVSSPFYCCFRCIACVLQFPEMIFQMGLCLVQPRQHFRYSFLFPCEELERGRLLIVYIPCGAV